MAIDYNEVLADLREQEAAFENSLSSVRAAISALEEVILTTVKQMPAVNGPYSGLGTKDAIIDLLCSEINTAHTASFITNALRTGGIRTAAADFAGSVSATLSQMTASGSLEKVGEGWKIREGSPAHQDYLRQRIREKARQSLENTLTARLADRNEISMS